jgi:ABC-2 type transport system ATP-binding protein
LEIRLNSAIVTQNLSKTYRSGLLWGHKVRALNDVNLQIPAGKIFGLLGPNGAGKTTLIKILLGIVHSSSGKAFIFNSPNNRQSTRRQIGYLPENLHIARHHTGVSALRFMGRLSRINESDIHKRLPGLIELVGLKGRENELVRTYSKGMKQRLGLAQALLHEPKILFLDEPTDGLDPVGRHHVRQVIERMRDEGKTVFINSHILQEVELICDQFAIMAQGNVMASGTLDDLLSKASYAASKTIIVARGNAAAVERVQSTISPIGTLSIAHLDAGEVVANVGDALLADSNAAATPAPMQDNANPDGMWKMELSSSTQSDIDRFVDVVRETGMSIRDLSVVQPKLEQIFMHLIQNNRPANSNH